MLAIQLNKAGFYQQQNLKQLIISNWSFKVLGLDKKVRLFRMNLKVLYEPIFFDLSRVVFIANDRTDEEKDETN